MTACKSNGQQLVSNKVTTPAYQGRGRCLEKGLTCPERSRGNEVRQKRERGRDAVGRDECSGLLETLAASVRPL